MVKQTTSKSLTRTELIKRDLTLWLKARPPGPNRPMTSDWILRFRDRALTDHPSDHPGCRSQTLKLVKRCCRNYAKFGQIWAPRVRKSPVTGVRNLRLAIQSLSQQDQTPAELRRSLFRLGVTKLSERSAITLHAVASPPAARNREARARAAAKALRRRKRWHHKWCKWVSRIRKVRAMRAYKRHQSAMASRWEKFTRFELARAEQERQDLLWSIPKYRERELEIVVPLWRSLVKGIIESDGFQAMWNETLDDKWRDARLAWERADSDRRWAYYEKRRKLIQRAARKIARWKPKPPTKWQQKAADRDVTEFLEETFHLTRPEATPEEWIAASRAPTKRRRSRARRGARVPVVAETTAIKSSRPRRAARPERGLFRGQCLS